MALHARRSACPSSVQLIWNAIEEVSGQQNITDAANLLAAVKPKSDFSENDFQRQLDLSVKDGLLTVKKKFSKQPGRQSTGAVDFYEKPDESPKRDSHDWYCFECHRGGSDMLLCGECWRVFHVFCSRDDRRDPASGSFTCSICCAIDRYTNDPVYSNTRPEDFHKLLGYTCKRLKEKVVPSKDLHHLPHSEDDSWRYEALIYSSIDLNTIEKRILNEEYRCFDEFEADAQLIVHNVVIFYGVHSVMADMARYMLRDCVYDLTEIRQCPDCYRLSTEKPHKHWFCQPCNQPHELVFAKQQGFTYWPAKVIRSQEGSADVRFFGGYHQRALIEDSKLRPINCDIQTLIPKKHRTPALQKAFVELYRHQHLLSIFLEGKDITQADIAALDSIRGPLNNVTQMKQGKRRRSAKGSARKSTKPSKMPRFETSVCELPVLESIPNNNTSDAVNKQSMQQNDQNSDMYDTRLPCLADSHLSESSTLPDAMSMVDLDKQDEHVDDSETDSEHFISDSNNHCDPKNNLPSTHPDANEKKSPVIESVGDIQSKGAFVLDQIPVVVKSIKRSSSPSCDDHNVVSSSSQDSSVTPAKPSVALPSTKEVQSVCVSCGLSSDDVTKACDALKKRLQLDFEEKTKKLKQQIEEECEAKYAQREQASVSATNQKLLECQVQLAETKVKLEKAKQEVLKRDVVIQRMEWKQQEYISSIKRKLWCSVCEKASAFHCCWITSYCSTECQMVHWHREHKSQCRRRHELQHCTTVDAAISKTTTTS